VRDIEITLDGDEIVVVDDRRLALDRRSYDVDKRLHVTDCVLTAAQVNPYMGSEIPGAEALGLDPGAIYQLYRDPAALRAAVPLFENLPLLIDHVAVSAADPKTQYICGTVSNARWQAGKILGDIAVWDQSAIDLIESGRQRDLSAGYRYVCKLGSGTAPDGTRFDARMQSIEPNHIALVVEGRVAGALVGDSALDIHIEFDMQSVIPGYNRLR
jgi:uncharacterized protein